jgi:hypothetical protein
LRLSIRIAVVIACFACERTPEPVPMGHEATPARAPSPKPSAAPNPEASAGISWTDPAAWKRVEAGSAMRKATYRIPKVKGDAEDAELGVFQFGGRGGSVEANVERWLAQFEGSKKSELKRSERKVDGLRTHLVEIASGTYASGMPGRPSQAKANYAMLGAIVEAPGGNWFFKLTGPKATVAQARADFNALIDSIKKR